MKEIQLGSMTLNWKDFELMKQFVRMFLISFAQRRNSVETVLRMKPMALARQRRPRRASVNASLVGLQAILEVRGLLEPGNLGVDLLFDRLLCARNLGVDLLGDGLLCTCIFGVDGLLCTCILGVDLLDDARNTLLKLCEYTIDVGCGPRHGYDDRDERGYRHELLNQL